MDLINTLETEWSKKFPGEPLPSNMNREKNYDNLSLQNTIRKCEQTIDELENKLQKELFLRDFLQKFTTIPLPTIESKHKTEDALTAEFTTNQHPSNPTIAGLLAEKTVSISTIPLNKAKMTPKEDALTHLQTQCEPDNNSDGSVSKTSNMKAKISDIDGKEDNVTLGVNIDANIQTGLNNNQEHFLKPEMRNKFDLTKTQQRFKSLSTNITQHKEKSVVLRPTVSLKKAMPPSLPPKPKKKQLSNVTFALSDTMSHNNSKSCSDNIKTNASEQTNLNASADPQIDLGGHLSTEVGNCSDICANDIKAGQVKSGAKVVESSSGKQVAARQPVLKQQRRLTITTETDSPTTTDVQLSESLTNIVALTTGSSDDNNNKENKQSKQDYSRHDTFQQPMVLLKETDHPQSTLLAEKGKPDERKSLVIKDQGNKKTSKPPIPTRRSVLSNNFECDVLPQTKSDCPSSYLQQQTITNQNRKETEHPSTSNDSKNREEGKENVVDTQLSLVKKKQPQEKAEINKDILTTTPAAAISTGDSDQNNTDHTDMSTFKKQRDDVCFVSYRKLDTDLYESSFTNNSTLPVPERRSTILKADTIITENQEDTVLIQKSNAPSYLARNSTFSTFGHRGDDDDTKQNLHENNGLQSGVDSKSAEEDSPVLKEEQSLLLNMKEHLDTENKGICQETEQKVAEDRCIEVKKNDFGKYKTCIELTDDDDDDDDDDSSEKKMLKHVTSGNQQSWSNSEEETDEEILSPIYEDEQFVSKEDINLLKMRKQAVRQFLATEKVFVESLENIQKLMDQFSATIDSKESLLSKTDFEVIFFRINEILSLHQTCVKQLAPKVQNWQNNETVGYPLKELMVHFPTFEEYTKNYPLAVETINKCSQINTVFKRIAEEASFNPEMQSSLSVLLYKPINQLQFNTSFIQELLHLTPKNHPDYAIIESTWRLTQHNLTAITNKSDEDKAENEQYLLKSDYLVELVGNVKKLRCFFLFNDVLVCTKEKFWQKGSFDVKWFIPIYQLLLDTNSDNDEMKHHSKETVEEIKRKISCLEAELRREHDKDKLSDRTREKHKKKLSELQRELARLSGYLEFILKHNKKAYTLLMSTDYAREEWKEAICGLKNKCAIDMSFTASEVQQLISNCKKLPNISNLSSHQQKNKMEDRGFVGFLCVTLHELTGLDESCTTYCCLELDSCGQFFTKARSATCNDAHPVWNEEFELELEYSHTLRILCYKKRKDNQGDILLGKSALALSKDWLSNFTRKTISMNKISLVISINHLPPNKTIKRIRSKVKTGTFGVDIQKVAHHQNKPFPSIISICTQEIENRGLDEVGIYRVSGGQSDIKKLKHVFEKNTMQARKMVANTEFNIHVVAAILKLYFRELPEPLFTTALHSKFLTVNDIHDAELKKENVIMLIHSLPDANYHALIHLLQHLQRISENSSINKMTNSNLAVIFGQSLLQPAPPSDQNSVEMASFLNVHLQNDILQYMMNLQCKGVHLSK